MKWSHKNKIVQITKMVDQCGISFISLRYIIVKVKAKLILVTAMKK
jgi:hypothetical protein